MTQAKAMPFFRIGEGLAATGAGMTEGNGGLSKNSVTRLSESAQRPRSVSFS
jgi:hypothetical protein